MVLTKVDKLKEFKKDVTFEEMTTVAENILSDKFPVLNTTIQDAVNQVNNRNGGWFKSKPKLEFKVIPMTVASSLVKGTFIKERDDKYIAEYSKLIEQGLLTTKRK